MIDGTWIPRTAVIGGRDLPRESLATMTLTLAGGEYTARVGEVTDRGSVRVDASRSPAWMDIKGLEGPNAGKTFLAICEKQGDDLRICYDLSGRDRPRSFSSEAGTQRFLVTYRRIDA